MISSDASPSARVSAPLPPVPTGSHPTAAALESPLVCDEQLDPIFTPQFAEHVATREQAGLVFE